MEVLVGREAAAPNFAMRHFVVEPGGHTFHHKHNYEHEVLLPEGEAEVVFEDTVHRAKAGDALYIDANKIHQFRNAGSGDLRFICLVPMQFDCGTPTPGT